MESQQTPPVSLRELASTLFIYKGTILPFTLVFCVGAAVVSLFQPEIFESSVQIWAQDQSPGLRGSSSYPNDSAARLKAALTNVREVIYSRRVLESALEQCGMLESESTRNGPPQQAECDRLVNWLSKSIRLEAPKGSDFGSSQIFFLRLRDRNATRAPQLLAAVLDSFRERYEQLSAEQAEHLLKETTNQLSESREQLKAATEKFDDCVRTLEG